MEIHFTETVFVQFISYAAIPFKAEIYANEFQIDWGDGSQSLYTGQEYYSLSHTFESEGLRQIRISGRKISYLNVSGLNLSGLNPEDCPNLTHLNCSSNELSELNLQHCPSLQELYCNSNNLQALDLSYNPEICLLQLSYNKISKLRLCCSKLKVLYCSENNLQALNIEGCQELCFVDVSANYLDTTQAMNLFKQLPGRKQSEKATIRYHSNPLQDNICEDILSHKNWY